jgi:hypothetical protein
MYMITGLYWLSTLFSDVFLYAEPSGYYRRGLVISNIYL